MTSPPRSLGSCSSLEPALMSLRLQCLTHGAKSDGLDRIIHCCGKRPIQSLLGLGITETGLLWTMSILLVANVWCTGVPPSLWSASVTCVWMQRRDSCPHAVYCGGEWPISSVSHPSMGQCVDQQWYMHCGPSMGHCVHQQWYMHPSMGTAVPAPPKHGPVC
jgi:hypothetical protein